MGFTVIEKFVFSELTEDTLYKLYVVNGQTCESIAQVLGITADAVSKHLKKHKINRQSIGPRNLNIEMVYTGKRKDTKDNLTKEVLLELCLQGKTDKEIGAIYGLTGEGVAYRRSKYGIGTEVKGKDKCVDIFYSTPKEVIEKDYLNLSQESFSAKYGISKTIWRPHLKKLNIVDKSEQRINKYPPFTRNQISLIVGGLLGKGSIGEKTYYYEFHPNTRYSYIKKKSETLHPYFSRISGGEGGNGYRISTVHHSNFKELYKMLYKEESIEKALPIEFLKKNWDDEILAYWFLDCGELDDETGEFRVPNRYFNKSQLLSFLSFLEGLYGTSFNLQEDSVLFSKGLPKSFEDSLLKIATPDLYHKLPEKCLDPTMGPLIDLKTVSEIKPKLYRICEDLKKKSIENMVFSYLYSLLD